MNVERAIYLRQEAKALIGECPKHSNRSATPVRFPCALNRKSLVLRFRNTRLAFWQEPCYTVSR